MCQVRAHQEKRKKCSDNNVDSSTVSHVVQITSKKRNLVNIPAGVKAKTTSTIEAGHRSRLSVELAPAKRET